MSDRPQKVEWMRAAEVADLLDVTVQTVYRWAEDGMLPYVRVGGSHYRFDPDDVNLLVRKHGGGVAG